MRRPIFIFSIFARPFPCARPPLRIRLPLLTALLLFTLFLLAAAPAFSQPVNSGDPSRPPREGANLKSLSERDPGDGGNTDDTRIVVDKQNHTVKIFAAGKQVVTIDAAGLHVKGNLDHTGTDTDLGEAEHAK